MLIFSPEHVFKLEQLYVALSRGIPKETTKVLINSSSYYVEGCTYNIVHAEIVFS